jgi:endonuclease/exonuclease/phosphatase family metal-dependent hydrolase
MIRTLEPMPTIVVGDFNEWGTISALDASTPGLRFLNPGASFPALRPLAHLDRFALSDELKVNDCGVFTMRPAPIASDHLPIWATLRMAR